MIAITLSDDAWPTFVLDVKHTGHGRNGRMINSDVAGLAKQDGATRPRGISTEQD